MNETEQRKLIYCGTCGVPWVEHTEACSRHSFQPRDAFGRSLALASIEWAIVLEKRA